MLYKCYAYSHQSLAFEVSYFDHNPAIPKADTTKKWLNRLYNNLKGLCHKHNSCPCVLLGRCSFPRYTSMCQNTELLYKGKCTHNGIVAKKLSHNKSISNCVDFGVDFMGTFHWCPVAVCTPGLQWWHVDKSDLCSVPYLHDTTNQCTFRAEMYFLRLYKSALWANFCMKNFRSTWMRFVLIHMAGTVRCSGFPLC